MKSNQMIAMLVKITSEDVENVYSDFYALCETKDFSGEDAAAAITHILTQYKTETNPQLKSFAFLFLGAILDNLPIAQQTAKNIATFLIAELQNLTNFEALDKHDNFIHFISHIYYCADSLVKTTLISKPDITALAFDLSDAYLRSDIRFSFREEILVAEFIICCKLSAPTFTKILDKLMPHNGQSALDKRLFATKEANKRNLWTAIMALNHQYKTQNPSSFDELVTKTTSLIFG